MQPIDREVKELRRSHGENAVRAYNEIAALFMSGENNSTAFMRALHPFFEKYGLEAVCAAIRLHAKQLFEIDALVGLNMIRVPPHRPPRPESRVLRLVRSSNK